MDIIEPNLLHYYLSLSATKYPDKSALIFGTNRWSYAEVNRKAEGLALTLRKLGLKKQERVVILLENCPEAVFAVYGVLKAGGVFVLLNGGTKAPKLAYILDDASPFVLITHVEKKNVIGQALKITGKKIDTIWIGDDSDNSSDPGSYLWNDIVKMEDSQSPLERAEESGSNSVPDEDDLATIIYTSGTTGEPKGIMAPHRSMIAAAKSIIQYLNNRPEDIVIVTLPLSFDYGLYQVIMAFMYGGTIVLEKSFLYPPRILERIAEEKVTGFPIVPTIAALMIKINGVEKYDLSSIRYISSTGAVFPEANARKLKELAPRARFFSMFGLTECKRVCFLDPEEWENRPDSVGKPMPGCEVFIVDEEGQEVEAGKVGEMVVRGPNVMKGYWNDLELTSRTYREWKFNGEKVLFTGDYFKKDPEGFLYFQGRRDDLVKTRGERVSLKEVETVLDRMTGVLKTAVIDIPDEIYGTSLVVFIVQDQTAMLGDNEVRLYCQKNLEPFMQPRFVYFLEELPLTLNGKIDKKTLRGVFSDSVGIQIRTLADPLRNVSKKDSAN